MVASDSRVTMGTSHWNFMGKSSFTPLGHADTRAYMNCDKATWTSELRLSCWALKKVLGEKDQTQKCI